MTPKKVNPVKASLVSDISDLLSRSKSVAVVDYRGLKVTQATDLRKLVKKAGGQVLVTKNTLFKIALRNNNPQLADNSDLSGTSAYIFSFDDEILPLKAIADYSKKNSLPVFKLGFLGDRILSAAEITQLASLPDKNTLIAKTLGTLNSPLFRLVYSLNWNISKLVRTLDTVRSSKSN
jgi:large subunit ribosomal protein L10